MVTLGGSMVRIFVLLINVRVGLGEGWVEDDCVEEFHRGVRVEVINWSEEEAGGSISHAFIQVIDGRVLPR